jgi:CRP/FNR family transcriptional regulator, cyclic AMP receptor protein
MLHFDAWQGGGMARTIREQLGVSGLFQDFPETAKDRLADRCRTQTFQDGEIIYHRGDQPVAMYGVLEGVIKLIGEDPSGKFFLYDLIGKGHWFGENSALDGEPRGQSALVVGDTRVMSLSRNDLLALLDDQPELYRHFVSVFCMRLRRAGHVFAETAFLPVNVRLALNLMRLEKVRRLNNVKLSQEEIAASLGVTRQSIYRVLKTWQAEGWVSVHYGDVKIEKPKQLKALIDNYK